MGNIRLPEPGVHVRPGDHTVTRLVNIPHLIDTFWVLAALTRYFRLSSALKMMAAIKSLEPIATKSKRRVDVRIVDHCELTLL